MSARVERREKKMRTMASMELDDEEKLDFCAPMPCERPEFPYGLRISLTDAEFKKLKCDPSDAEVGGICHGHFLARVTSVSQNKNGDGEQCWRVEMQIEDLDIESEDLENKGK
jgi:hypothetical protein